MARLLALFLVACTARAQLPTSAVLSDSDWRSFRGEVSRIESLLLSALDKAAVSYAMARTWASAGQWTEAMQWLRRTITLRAGIDPDGDSIFAALRGTREFADIADEVQRTTPPISRSTLAFVIPEGDLVPESIAYDPKGKYFYLGSMTKGKVVRCSAQGRCADFARGLGTVLGLRIARNGLWLLSNSDDESSLVRFDLVSARVISKHPVKGGGHTFNDLVIAPSGDAYITDTRASAVWHLAKGASDLTRLPVRFEFANGIAISPGGGKLFVATFPDGITTLDLKTNLATPIARPADLCLMTIDGLYYHRGALIAVQGGYMVPRVARFALDRSGRTIEHAEVLERRNVRFNGITTGVVVGGSLYYMANIQDGKTSGFEPIAILKLRI